MWICFRTKLLQLTRECIPCGTFSSSKRPPWLNRNVKKLINLRDKLSKKAKRTIVNHALTDKLKNIRNKVKNSVLLAQKTYIHDIVGDIKNSPSRFYKYINSKRMDGHNIPPINMPAKQAVTDRDKSEALNNYFASVFTTENTNLIPNIHHQTPFMKNFTITENGVYILLSKLNPKKAVGPDNISPRVLVECAREVAPMLTYIFNQSLDSGEVPDDWKQANISPIFKKGRKDLAENYRPVSLTSVVSKVFEHIIFSNVAKHLERYSILTPKQHGFRSGHSCESQLICAIDDWSRILDKKSHVDIAILDFSKAFDTVPHQRLKNKLIAYGITGKTLTWILSFLSNRKQRVQINGSQSSWVPVLSGVPQGTVLGPLLFLIYINDIVKNINSNIRLFADDCVIYREIKTQTDCQVLQSDLNTLCDWQEKWQMQFNTKKCYIMHMTRKHKYIQNIYTMVGVPLSTTKQYPYLGIEIENNLKWGGHVTKVCNKANKILGLLRRNVGFCDKGTKALAYLSLVRPCLEFATSAWSPHLVSHIRLIENVQRRSARFVNADYKYSSSVSAMLHSLRWPSLESRRHLNQLSMFYKAVHGQTAIPIDHLTVPTRTTRQSSVSSQAFIHLPSSCDTYRYSFFPQSVAGWNKLPDVVRCKPSVESFRLAAAESVLHFY